VGETEGSSSVFSSLSQSPELTSPSLHPSHPPPPPSLPTSNHHTPPPPLEASLSTASSTKSSASPSP